MPKAYLNVAYFLVGMVMNILMFYLFIYLPNFEFHTYERVNNYEEDKEENEG